MSWQAPVFILVGGTFILLLPLIITILDDKDLL